MTQNKKIAITGGIGSGKSAVCEIVRALGYPVYSADEIYHALLKDNALISALHREFGVAEEGTLDRKKLARIVFSDPKALRRLNEITHPLVMQKLLSSMREPISFAEVPLLFEGGFAPLFDAVLVVTRDRESRINAVRQRDGLSREEAERRMQNQFDYEKNDLSAHTVIENDDDFASLRSKVEIAIEQMLQILA